MSTALDMRPPPELPLWSSSVEEEDRPHNYDQDRYQNINDKEPVNLTNDSVIHNLIAWKKTHSAVAFINTLKPTELGMLGHQNYYGDTPLHIAAEIGDSTVAKALLKRDDKLARERNRKGETPLHKAVQFGHIGVFHSIMKLFTDKSIAYDRTDDGSTILHYAIMHDQTEKALVIAKDFPRLIPTRNTGGASPLQIMAAFYKKPHKTGTLISRLYKHLCLDKDASIEGAIGDEDGGIGAV